MLCSCIFVCFYVNSFKIAFNNNIHALSEPRMRIVAEVLGQVFGLQKCVLLLPFAL